MITYVGNDNEQYTLLFKTASAKIGLVPIDKEEVVNGAVVTRQYKRIFNSGNNKWELVLCDSEDFDENGNFLITKVVNGQQTKVIAEPISSLNEYFQHITELGALATNKGRTGSDPYLLRLPLDEPFFEINANTRGITVPGELSQIAVKGDKLAEVLFFRIDRYYDAIDLDTRHIYIEWEVPDGEGGVRRGISRDFLRDTQSQKNKIIFGWAIGEELTKFPGTIRFAVRFVEWVDKGDTANAPSEGTGLMYSFSSLPATISVGDTLNYSLFEDDESLKFITADDNRQLTNLYTYLEDSLPDNVDESTVETALPAIFYRDLNVIEGTSIQRTVPVTFREETVNAYVHNLNGGGIDRETNPGSLDLEVAAYARDGGDISYLFNYRDQIDQGSSPILDAENRAYISRVFEEDDEPNENVVYYSKAADGVWEPVAASSIEKDGETVYYEKGAKAIANKPGYYFVNARNRVGGLQVSNSYSSILYVPYAQEPHVDSAIQNNFVIKNASSTLELDTSVDQRATGDAGKVSNIAVVQSAQGPAAVTLQPGISVVDEGNSLSNLSYQWYVADNENMENATPITQENGGTNQSYEASAPGYYAVEITNHFNEDEITTNIKGAGVCRVTRMPTIPVIEWDAFQNILIAGRATQPKIEIQEVEHDSMSYEWHKIVVSETSGIEEGDVLAQDPVATDDFPLDFPASGTLEFVNGVAEIPFVPKHEGLYYFILKNELNGAVIHMNSATAYGVIDVRPPANNNNNNEDNNG